MLWRKKKWIQALPDGQIYYVVDVAVLNRNDNDNVHVGEEVNFPDTRLDWGSTIGAGALASMIACLLLDPRMMRSNLLGCVTQDALKGWLHRREVM